MIKVLDYIPNLTPKAVCTLFADTKDEVTGTLSIVGLPQGVTPDTGSALLTASGDVAFLTSEGTWVFVGDEESGGDS